jgi:hypothetical protein
LADAVVAGVAGVGVSKEKDGVASLVHKKIKWRQYCKEECKDKYISVSMKGRLS